MGNGTGAPLRGSNNAKATVFWRTALSLGTFQSSGDALSALL